MTTDSEAEFDLYWSALGPGVHHFTGMKDSLTMCKQVNPGWALGSGGNIGTVECLDPAVRNESWVYVHGPVIVRDAGDRR
jgi:hypothetical protein